MSNTNADDTSHYEGALLEEMRDQLSAVLEAVGDLPRDVRELKVNVVALHDDADIVKVNIAALHDDVVGLKVNVSALQADMEGVKADLTVIKSAVVEQSTDLDNHERRITRLEHRAA